jgi:HK97 family phage portal protein
VRLLEAISNGLGLRPRPQAAVLASSVPLTDRGFYNWWSGGSSFTGRTVSVDQALKLSTVWACVRMIAGTIATLPLGFYERKPDGSRVPAVNQSLYEILHSQPNADQTAVVFWQCVAASLLLWGNAFVEITRDVRGGVIALNYLMPSRVTYRRMAGGEYRYFYVDNVIGTERVIDETRMMHIPAFTTDGKWGLSPVAYGANVLGSTVETDRTASETFSNSLRSPGVISMDMVFKKDQREEIRKHVREVSESGGVMVLERGAKFEKLSLDPVSAELLATRAWNVEEICRWYGVDPSMVGHGAKDSNWGTGLEQKMLWLIAFTLRQWCVSIEQAIRKNLIPVVERQRYFAEFGLEGLLRGDSTARAGFYASATQNGWMTRDEVRQKENLSPMGGNAAVLTVQSNMLPIDKLGAEQAQAAAQQADQADRMDQADRTRRAEFRDMLTAFATRPQPPINVDARTDVQPTTVNVHVPEQAPPVVTVDARTEVHPAPPAEVNVNVEPTPAPNVHVDGATIHMTAAPAPNVNVEQPQITVNVPKGGGRVVFEEDDKGNLTGAVIDG